MERITDHVWWQPPGPPDRPSLCAVVGTRWTLMLDAGSSPAHTREALAGLPSRPDAVLLTHSHWDHVFGAVEVGGLLFAYRETVVKLHELRNRDWNDEERVNEHIRRELPAPRTVEIAPVDVAFDEQLDLDLGGVTVHARYVESDHCDDAVIVYVGPDRLLFLGDALCPGPQGEMTEAKAFPLFDTVLAYDAEHFVEGHHPAVTNRAEMVELLDKARRAARGQGDPADEDAHAFLTAFAAGRDLH
jgi:glyoxylase-like metal-dependent hydrolase (beta-lactamase superfamily II)